MSQNQVFISYSHKDEVWKDRLLPQLQTLQRVGLIDVWDDRKIDAGETWYPEIQEAMERAVAAVLLVSDNFLALDFITKEEVPFLLERREEDGMLVIPVLLAPCPWKFVPWLKQLQMLPRDGKNVAQHFRGRHKVVFVEVAEQIGERFADPNYRPPIPKPSWPPLLEAHLDIKRLPETGSALFGRTKELHLLDDAWESDATHVVSLVAYGGVGKSTLVNKWLEGLERDNYRGAERVFAWSFYSQGTRERVTSADLFISKALAFFGDPKPDEGSPWDKGERLAKLVGQNRTLLVLDGMEPLQSGQQVEYGKVKDPALATLLRKLAKANAGLCVISTRVPVTDLAERDTVQEVDLQVIAPNGIWKDDLGPPNPKRNPNTILILTQVTEEIVSAPESVIRFRWYSKHLRCWKRRAGELRDPAGGGTGSDVLRGYQDRPSWPGDVDANRARRGHDLLSYLRQYQ